MDNIKRSELVQRRHYMRRVIEEHANAIISEFNFLNPVVSVRLGNCSIQGIMRRYYRITISYDDPLVYIGQQHTITNRVYIEDEDNDAPCMKWADTIIQSLRNDINRDYQASLRNKEC